jgi:hypothetical protein
MKKVGHRLSNVIKILQFKKYLTGASLIPPLACQESVPLSLLFLPFLLNKPLLIFPPKAFYLKSNVRYIASS